MNKIIAIAAGIFLSGCSTPKLYQEPKNGKTAEIEISIGNNFDGDDVVSIGKSDDNQCLSYEQLHFTKKENPSISKKILVEADKKLIIKYASASGRRGQYTCVIDVNFQLQQDRKYLLASSYSYDGTQSFLQMFFSRKTGGQCSIVLLEKNGNDNYTPVKMDEVDFKPSVFGCLRIR